MEKSNKGRDMVFGKNTREIISEIEADGSNNKLKIYLAGPLGFSEAGRFFMYEILIPEIKNQGFEVINPWELNSQEEIDRIQNLPPGYEKDRKLGEMNYKLGERNALAIDRSDGVFAVLDGPDVDSGTASEIGYACASGKKILGYRGDFRLSSENMGSKVNLQVSYFIEKSGGKIIESIDDLEKGIDEVFGSYILTGR